MRLPALLLGIALFVLVWCCAAALARPPAPGEVTMRTAYEAHIQGRLHEAGTNDGQNICAFPFSRGARDVCLRVRRAVVSRM
jgi:hypothetical protein